MKRLPFLLFVILLAMCGVVGWLAFQEPAFNQAGIAHPEHPAMALGADGEARHRDVLGVGFAFAVLIVVFFVGLLFFALHRRGEAVPGKGTILFAAVLFLGAFVALFWTYSRFMEAPGAGGLFLGFPVPTAWMLYGVWGIPLLFILIYVARFNEWVFGAAEETEYTKLLERVRRARTGTQAPTQPSSPGASRPEQG
ncbi:MAG TPA: hypothetical protein VMT85_05015 [Thermoanaerobaculia bacterium]|nr:hypothetical protein [Thermoanaerobaculia bacterium]